MSNSTTRDIPGQLFLFASPPSQPAGLTGIDAKGCERLARLSIQSQWNNVELVKAVFATTNQRTRAFIARGGRP